ncbi:xylulokinase [Martelella alba]|uniref:Xylulose kinase n=1 Tax=Martelella alba TaxID=2590451 RepID=A0ABY2SJA9_9HYPH|nr:xylulokinase [Martelella alba]TKI04092.1 xylulokinase [Martelella alba]
MYLGIDCGTQGAKVLLWDSESESCRASGYAPYQPISDRVGQQEQWPSDWLAAISRLVNEVVAQSGVEPGAVKGIGVSGQQHGLILLDAADQVIRPAKLWCDTETAPALEAFLAGFPARHHGKTVAHFIGTQIPVAYTLGKLLWVKAHEPDAYRRIAKIMLPHDYINFWLTGEYRAECGDASGTGYFDTHRRCWSQDVLDDIDPRLFGKMPPLLASRDLWGRLTPRAAAALGLPAGVPVASGGGDNMMSAIGTGNIEPGILTMSLGTSGTLFTHADRQIDTAVCPDINAFCSSSDGWLPLVSTMNVANAINAYRDILDIALADFDAVLSASRPGAGGLLSYPWFNGSRLPNRPDATASLSGITTRNFTKPNILRSVVEGVTFKLCKGIDIFKQCGLTFEQMRVIGGGAKSRLWCQMIADISGIEVIRPAVSDAGALGAAWQAHWCCENAGDKAAPLRDRLPASLIDSRDDVFTPHGPSFALYRGFYQRFHENMAYWPSRCQGTL